MSEFHFGSDVGLSSEIHFGSDVGLSRIVAVTFGWVKNSDDHAHSQYLYFRQPTPNLEVRNAGCIGARRACLQLDPIASIPLLSYVAGW